MWKAFAQRGMGFGASVKNADDTDPVPSFADSARARARTSRSRFKGKGGGTVYIGRYEARVTPVADLVEVDRRWTTRSR